MTEWDRGLGCRLVYAALHVEIEEPQCPNLATGLLLPQGVIGGDGCVPVDREDQFENR